MKTFGTSVVALLMTVTAASANNNEALLLTSGDLVNVSALVVSGDMNRLTIVQQHPGLGAANAISVEINGNRNGGPVGASFSGVVAKTNLSPGQLNQNGVGNRVEAKITGDGNLFAFSQIGNSNTVIGTVNGYQNQAAVVQTGNNNFASFSQNGIGNMVSVRQHAW